MPDRAIVSELIQRLPCAVVLPAEQSPDFFSATGPLPTTFGDQRQFPRFHSRTEAALVIRRALPAFPRNEKPERVYVKDISRNSICFLHSRQMFPGEELDLLLVDGVPRSSRVTRCRKLQGNCFEVGARFVERIAPNQPAAEQAV